MTARRSNPGEDGTPIVLWHGGRKWDGPPEIRGAKKGRAEHGPGIYLATSYSTVRKYAKGGGSIIRVELEPNVRWLSRVRVPVTVAKAFVKDLPRLSHRADILTDLDRAAARDAFGTVPLAATVNLMVNYDVLRGETGPLLAAWLVAQGADADLVQQGDEDWVVLFNPAKVRTWRVVPARDVNDLPLVRDRAG